MRINKWPSDEVVATLTGLCDSDYLKVRWRDAAAFRDIKTPETVYYTPKETLGRFHTLIDDHLILITETGHDGYEGTIIPLGCVERVKILTRLPKGHKESKKAFRAQGPVKILEVVTKLGGDE